MNYLDNIYEMKGLIEHGFYNGYDYAIYIVHDHPCCYVFLKDTDPYTKVNSYNEVKIPMHGGCTYLESMEAFKKGHPDIELFLRAAKVLGWDYAHYNDWSPWFPEGKHWSFGELKDEVKKVIDCLIDIKGWKGNYD